jgi:hypothetical protein
MSNKGNNTQDEIGKFEKILGKEGEKTVNETIKSYHDKYDELQVLTENTIFPKVKEVLTGFFQNHLKLLNCFESCLTNDKETSWIDHWSWVIVDAATNHVLREFPSQHCLGHIPIEDWSNYYSSSDEFMHDVQGCNEKIQDIHFRFSVDVMEDNTIIIMLLETS